MGNVTFDRLAGVLVGAACADSLGAGYEFGAPVSHGETVRMRGQGAFAPGEWTDDTAQLIAIAKAAADGADLTTPHGEDLVAANLQDWYLSPARLKDIGIHSSAVFGAVSTLPVDGLAERFRSEAAAKEARQPRSSGGNGALMRTSAVAMALYGDPAAMVETAMRLASMTHADELSSQSCAVWCLAVRAALMTDDPSDLDALAAQVDADVATYLSDAAEYWRGVLKESFGTAPVDYYDVRPGNGYCVTTLRAAWAAVTGTPVPADRPGLHFRMAVETAVRGGGDTDTVACVAGAVLGALWGYSAILTDWRRQIFGWPDVRDRDLLRIADAIQRGGFAHVDPDAWPHAEHFTENADWPHTESLAVHPHDDGVVLSGIDAAYGRMPLPDGQVDAVVSLCRVGSDDLAGLGVRPESHVEVRLIDQGWDANPNLRVVMEDAADVIREFRGKGLRVLLHCVAAQSRTPTVAALYAVRHLGIAPDVAIAEVCAALPAASPNPALRQVVLES